MNQYDFIQIFLSLQIDAVDVAEKMPNNIVCGHLYTASAQRLKTGPINLF